MADGRFRPMADGPSGEDPLDIGKVVWQEDTKSSETRMGTTDDERDKIFKLTAAQVRLLRVRKSGSMRRLPPARKGPRRDASPLPVNRDG